MRIRIGYDLAFNSSTPIPTILMLAFIRAVCTICRSRSRSCSTRQFHLRPIRITLAISAREL